MRNEHEYVTIAEHSVSHGWGMRHSNELRGPESDTECPASDEQRRKVKGF